MTSADPPSRRHTFRQRGSVVLGAVCMVACTGMFLGSLSQTNLTFAGVMALGTCWAFVLLVRPSLQLSEAGVHVNNPLRHTTIPWPLVEDCLTRWNLQVYAGDRVVTAWAISSSIERPKRSWAFGSGPPAGQTPRPAPGPGRPGSSTPAIASLIEEGRAEWHEEVASGLLADDPSARVVRSWDWIDVVLLFGPLLLLVVGVLTG